jgi:hypothetical protein
MCLLLILYGVVINMKKKKKKEQFQIAETLFEMGLDFDVIETISGINPTELLLKQVDLIKFEDEEKEE